MSNPIKMRLTLDKTGESDVWTLEDTPDWTNLVENVIEAALGPVAAQNRQDLSENETEGIRSWTGLIDGDMYTIDEV